jgi:hypothetical protein
MLVARTGRRLAPIAVACSTMVNASIGDSVKNGLIGNPDGFAIRVPTLRRCLDLTMFLLMFSA